MSKVRLSELNVSKIKKTGFCMAQSAAFRSLLWATAPVSSGKWVLKRWINESANLDPGSFAGICLWKNRSPRKQNSLTDKGPAKPAPSNAASVEPAGPDAEWSLSCLRFSCVHPHGFIWLIHVHSTSFDTKKEDQAKCNSFLLLLYINWILHWLQPTQHFFLQKTGITDFAK